MTIKDATVKRLTEICKQRDITYNKLAEISGVTPSTFYSFLNPKRKRVSLAVLQQICDGLEISLKDFFDDVLFDNLDKKIK